MKIYVFSENVSLTAELIGKAKEIDVNAEVTAIVASPAEEMNAVSRMGVSQVFWLGETGGRLIDDFVPTIAELIKANDPDMFLVGATVCGKAVAARVAARLNTAAVVNAKAITADKTVSHVIYGGGAVRTEAAKEGVLIATLTPGSADAAKAEEKDAPVVNVAFIEPSCCAKIVERTPKKTGGTGILSAKRVVGVGRGFYNDEDLQYAKNLADELGAAVGYTRPVIELGLPSLEGEPYIGVSGIQLKPDLYVAVAVSGQTQHTVGINESRVIVCINNDAEAPMFKFSDYGIVGDYKEVLPALAAAIKASK